VKYPHLKTIAVSAKRNPGLSAVDTLVISRRCHIIGGNCALLYIALRLQTSSSERIRPICSAIPVHAKRPEYSDSGLFISIGKFFLQILIFVFSFVDLLYHFSIECRKILRSSAGDQTVVYYNFAVFPHCPCIFKILTDRIHRS